MRKPFPKFTRLLATVILYMVVSPFVPAGGTAASVLGIAFLLVLAVSIFDLGLRPRVVVLVLVLLWTPAIVANLLSIVFEASVPAALFSQILLLVFLLFALTRLFREVMNHDNVTSETVRGAICVYLFIGFAFASSYALLDTVEPGSFRFPEPTGSAEQSELTTAFDGDHGRQRRFTYFSFVTLSTLGFGDITPVTERAGNLAILEAIIGQLFIAIIIARIVAGRTAARSPAHPLKTPGDSQD